MKVIDPCSSMLCMQEAVARVRVTDSVGCRHHALPLCPTHLQEIRDAYEARPKDWPTVTLHVEAIEA